VIVAFSSSSPVASVALFSESGELLAEGDREASMRASEACLSILQELLQKTNLQLSEASLIVADLGPGSFTGVKVAVTLAKSLAFALSVPTAGANSFDLISADRTAVLPSKKGEWFIRGVGQEPVRQADLPEEEFLGYGPGLDKQSFPLARNFQPLIPSLKAIAPELLVPEYLIEPSISVPKSPLSPIGGDRS
jgi:tRNA threonylcarbamoyl adenosine modification protein YeaZ